MTHISPLRYPGGKASLTDFLEDVIDLNDLRGEKYLEPYAGGAGAALGLLQRKIVSEIFINDLDPRIFAFWSSILNESERFCEKISTCPLDLKFWHQQREITLRPAEFPLFERGFAAFFMNRCNRSGVIVGAGPIGGYEQKGRWLIGARFNRTGLAERVREIAAMRDAIHLTNLDALKFLKRDLPRGKQRLKVLVYLDPPYVEKGKRLYHNAYEAKDHSTISCYLAAQKALPWLLSYDDTPLIRNLYRSQNIFSLPIRYSLQKKRNARELLIVPDNLWLPAKIRNSNL